MRRKNIIILILSFIFSLFMCIGVSFDNFSNFKLFYEMPLLFLALFSSFTFLLFHFINFVYKYLDTYKFKDFNVNKKFITLFDNRPFTVSLVVILLGWLIYIIAFYPTIMTPDAGNQVLQFFGIDNYYSHISILLDESQIITNHHPVLHTLIIGSCVNIGKMIGSVNLGLFLYSLLQITLMSFTLSYTIKYMKELGVNVVYRLILLCIYTFVPVFPFYAMTCVKDSIFGPLFILYVIMISRIVIKNEEISFKRLCLNLILMIFLMLIRNNGFHVIILTLPILLFIKVKNKFKILGMVIFVLLFNYSYNNLVLPYFKVTPSSPREMLSIPFQQTARYVLKYKDEITEEERENIDKILIYDTLPRRYDPEISDPVKNKFNKYSTDTDLKNYFDTWFTGLKKHPMVYIEATLHNTYGYYYPFKINWVVYHNFKDKIVKNGFDYHFNSLSILRNILSGFAISFIYFPILGLIINVGFNCWLLLFLLSYLIHKKKYREIVILMPCFVSLLVCIASPVNVYFRYALPNVFVMPTLIGIIISIFKRKGVCVNEK